MKFALKGDVIRRRWPPKGGWIYHEINTGWTAPSPMADNFDSTVDKIIRHRLANRGHGLSVDRMEVELPDIPRTQIDMHIYRLQQQKRPVTAELIRERHLAVNPERTAA